MSSPPPPSLIAALTTGAIHLQAGKMFQLASYVMVVYDNLITLGDEVERIWSKPMSGASILFLINRHLTPLEFMPVIIAFHLPSWTKNTVACNHFVRYEGGGTLALVAICEIIMMLRVYALWGRNSWILAFLVILWIAQVVFCGVAMANTMLVPLPPGFIGCILTGTTSVWWTPFWVMPLITDSFIFILTMIKTRQKGFNKEMPLLAYFRRDGILYFICICVANIINVCFFFAATEDLKAIGASFSQLITSVMVNRLVLNLRGVSTTKPTYEYSGPRSTDHSLGGFRRDAKPSTTSTVDSFTTTLIGNLGEDVADDNDQYEKNKSYELQTLPGYYPRRR